jgi:hypothetical protein
MKTKRAFTTTVCAILFACLLSCGLAFLGGAFAPPAIAQGKGKGVPGLGRCSVRSLDGVYAIEFSGSFIGVGPVATLGTIRLDGAGNFEVTDTASFNGVIVDRVGAGTYTVESDCTGSATVLYSVGQPGRQATFNFVISNQGRDVSLIGTTPGGIVSGSAKPIS